MIPKSSWEFNENANVSSNVTCDAFHLTKELKLKPKTKGHKIQESTPFLPLKGTRFTGFSDQGHTWFIRTFRGKKDNGISEHVYF